MTDDDLIDPESPEARASLSAEDAFQQSGELYFRGSLDKPVKLQPSKQRAEYAAQSLGNKLLSGAANIQDGALYDGFLHDLVCMIYLCVCPASEVMLAHRKPADITEKAFNWADKHGICPGGPHFEEAATLYWRIFEQINASRFKLAPARGGDAPEKNV